MCTRAGGGGGDGMVWSGCGMVKPHGIACLNSERNRSRAVGRIACGSQPLALTGVAAAGDEDGAVEDEASAVGGSSSSAASGRGAWQRKHLLFDAYTLDPQPGHVQSPLRLVSESLPIPCAECLPPPPPPPL